MQTPIPRTLLLSLLLAGSAAAQLTVTATTPALNASNVSPATEIVLDFDRALLPGALTSGVVSVFGRSTGPAAGTWTLESSGTRARFTPGVRFSAGEVVTVCLSEDLTAADTSTLRTEGYTFQFQIGVRPSGTTFTHLATHVVRSIPTQSTRVYGAQATDLDDDGWLDVAVVNQNTSDVRVLMNRADGSGNVTAFLTPVNSTGSTPSPNESADMNGDGIVDIVTANKVGDSVSVLIGRGDGTFLPRVNYPAGDLPRGLAVLDMDGDGDTDVVTANANSSDLSLFFNNGAGVLSPQVRIQGGGAAEWGLAAGDMNEDGILDLVVGAQFSERVIVMRGNGDGTFTQAGVTDNVGGGVWMIVLGDVDGDGHLDAALANGTSDTASILLGDGQGNLAVHQSTSVADWVVATDLGDLDGDGDLDWMLSSFTGGGFTLLLNDGAGNFAFDRFFPATANAACTLMVDIDNDLDLDLILLDEIADEVVILENTPLGTEFCVSTPNSTGSAARASATGSASVAANDLTLRAGPLPNGFGFFFYGSAQAPPSPTGNGTLCLGGSLFRSPVANATGLLLAVELDLSSAPANTITAGSTWYFQGIFRDAVAGGAAFDLSDGVAVTFL
jgi:hypothetical protein